MFNIRFVENGISYEEEGFCGEISIGKEKELFFSNTSFFSKKKYEYTWRKSAEKILETNKSYFLINVYKPVKANFIEGWSCTKIDNKVFFQNKIFFRWQFSMKKISNLEMVPQDMKFFNEDGRKISTWSTDVESIEHFLSK